MSRTSNSLKIVISSFLCQVVIMICGFILPPLMISVYGSEINGLLALVKQLMVYFSVVCLGLGAAAQVALYKPIADSDWNAINSILSETKKFYNVSGKYFAIFIIFTSALLPFIIKTNINPVEIALIVLITGVGGICEYVIISKYRIFLVANQQQYVNSRITAEGIILNTIISIILIKFDVNVVFIQLGSTIVYILRLWQTIRYVKNRYKQVSFKSNTANIKLSNRWTAFSYELSNMIIQLSPSIIVAIALNLTEVSIFSVYFMVFNALAMICAIFSSGIQAPFGEIIANHDNTALKRAFSDFEFTYTLILSICYAGASILLVPFVGAYIHNTDGVNYQLPVFSFLMCIYFFLRYLRIPYTTLVSAKGLFKINNRNNIIEAIVFLILGVIFTTIWGLNGIPIAGILSATPRTILFITNCKKNFNGVINITRTIIKYTIILIIVMPLSIYGSFASSGNLLEWIYKSIPIIIFVMVGMLIVNASFDVKPFKSILIRVKSLKR